MERKKLWLHGFCPISSENGQSSMYDYVGVVYPEGVLSTDKIIAFNHKQISNVFFVGYTKNEEERAFKLKLIEKVKEYRAERKNKADKK